MHARAAPPPRVAAATARAAPPPPPPRLSWRRLCAAAGVAAVGALAVAAKLAGAAHVQRLMASFEPGALLEVSPESASVHAGLLVVDLHCDASWVQRCVAACVRDVLCRVRACVRCGAAAAALRAARACGGLRPCSARARLALRTRARARAHVR
jgi:hypothetical protein